MDTLIYFCGAFVVVGGLWLGYLGVFGHLKSQKVLGLCVLFGTLFFVLTGGFLFLLQRLQQQESESTERPELHVAFKSISLVLDKPPTVTTIIRNTGGEDAYRIKVCSSTYLNPKSFSGPLRWSTSYAEGATIGGMPDVIPKRDVYVQDISTAGYPMTQPRLDAVADGSAVLYWAIRGTYEDKRGNKFTLNPVCYVYDPNEKSMYICRKQYTPTDDDPNKECPDAN